MEVSSDWIQISTAGAVLQKLGMGHLSVAYSLAEPDEGITGFVLDNNHVSIFPVITGKNIWVRAVKGSVVFNHEDLVE